MQNHKGEWVAGGHIQRLAVQHSTYTPQNVGRRLRELAAVGAIEVKIEKGHAYYRYTGEAERKRLAGLAYFESMPDMPVKQHETGVH